MRTFFLIVFLLLLTPAAVLSQQKENLGIDEELAIDPQDNEEAATDENSAEKPDKESTLEEQNVVVEGEDEQLIQNRKEETKTVMPDDPGKAEWEEPADQIIKKEKKGTKKVEKRAQIMTEYGAYNSLGTDIYITKRDNYGIYLLEYNRTKHDGEGYNNKLISNSEFSRDYLNLVAGFRFDSSYRMTLITRYEDFLTGLQQNSEYDTQFKRGGFFEMRNEFRPDAEQKASVSLKGDYIGSDIAATRNSTRTGAGSEFARGKGEFKWQYMFSERNAIAVESSLWYAEQTLYDNSNSIYRAGDFMVWDIFRLYRSYIGENRTPLQIDVTLGMKIFYAQKMNTVWGPILAIDSFFGNWHSKLSLERTGRLPEPEESFLQSHYTLPVFYSQPEEYWKAEWKNKLKITRDSALKWNAGYTYFTRYYNPGYSTTTAMYTDTAQKLAVASGGASWEQNVTADFFWETGIKGEYQQQDVNLRAPASAFIKASYVPAGWELALEAVFTGRRKVVNGSDLEAFTLMNLKIEREINPTIRFFIRGENLLNEKYYHAWPYEASGVKGYAGLHIFI